MLDFGPGWPRLVKMVMVAALILGAALLVSQHLQHVAGILPYLFLIACPLMHFFGHGHSHHHRHEEPEHANKA